MLLVVVTIVGLVPRFRGVPYGLPYTFLPDEPTLVNVALQMLRQGDLNPHWFYYPSLMFYLNVLVFAVYYLSGRVVGVFASPLDLVPPEIITMGVGNLELPALFFLSRGLSVVMGTGTVMLTYAIGRQLYPNRFVALLAALLVAVSPAAVSNSQRIAPDSYVLFFAVLSCYYSIRLLDDARLRNYVAAGISAGLAVSSKYNAAVVMLPLLLSHCLQFGWHGLRRKEIYFGLLAAAIAFFLTTPFVIFDLWTFMQGLGYQAYSYSLEGHAGQEGNSLQWYVSYLFSNYGIAVSCAVFQLANVIYSRSKVGLVLASFPCVYFAIVSQFVIRNERTILLVIPFIALLAAWFLANLYSGIQFRAPRVLVVLIMLLFALGLLYAPFFQALEADRAVTRPDARQSASRWLENNLQQGTRIAQESYTPYLDTRRYVVQGIDALVDRPPDWYAQNGFEYVVASSGMFERFYADPERYAEWIEKYERFFQHYFELKRFAENGYEIRVYKTDAQLPTHRVAARFGDYGDIIELVGYETSAPRAGAPLHLKLFWRPLRETPEPLALETRVFGQADDEIAKVRTDLFQGKGWQNEMFAVEWTILLPNDAPRGPYRVQLNVIQTRFEYAVPAQNWRGEGIDPVILSVSE